VQEAKVTELGRHEVTIRLFDAQGRPTVEVNGGEPVEVRVTAFPPRGGGKFDTELQVRHLESGTIVYRGQSHSSGATAVEAGPDGGLDVEWSFEANLGRGHYSVTCAVLNEEHRWVAASAPALLTVNERQSEQALVFLKSACRMRPLGAAAHTR
jgi:hypothetical protein